MMRRSLLWLAILGLTPVGPAVAQQQPAPAARVGDDHVCPLITGIVPHVGGVIADGSADVLIEGKPAATVGSMAHCVGSPDSVARGATTVFINGKPAARRGDRTAHGGKVTEGATTVFIETAPPAEPKELPEPFEIEISAERERLPEPFEVEVAAEREELPEPFELEVTAEREELPEPFELEVAAARQELPEPFQLEVPAAREELPEPFELEVRAERQELPEPFEMRVSAERQKLPEPLVLTVSAERELEVPDVTGLSFLEAQRRIRVFDLRPLDQPLLGDAAKGQEQPGTVRETRPAAGTPVEARSAVALVLFGPKAEEEPEPETEPEPGEVVADAEPEGFRCPSGQGIRKQYDPVEDRFYCACPDGLPVPAGGRCVEQVAETKCGHIRGAEKLYDPVGDRFFCVCPDGRPITRGACPEVIAEADCRRFEGSVRVYDRRSNRMICVCPDGARVDPAIGRCPEPEQPQPTATPDRCAQFNAQLQAAPNATMATMIIRRAQQAGCDVPMGVIASVNNWVRRENEVKRNQRQQQQTQLFNAIMGGMTAIIQHQQRTQAPTRPSWTPGPAPTPAAPPPVTSPAAPAPPPGGCPGGRQQRVCVEEVESYQASDGRNSCCGPGGKIDNAYCRNANLTCTTVKSCKRWETRCN